MSFQTHLVAAAPLSHASDLLAVLVREGAASADKEGKSPPKLNDALLAEADKALGGLLVRATADEEFTGKEAQQLSMHTHGKLPAARLLVLGLGKKRDADKDRAARRRAAARAAPAANAGGAK